MSQKTNSMIKLALVFFISLLSFSIGTYVGKKYSDNQHKLSQLEPNKKSGHEAGNSTEFAHEEGQATEHNTAKNTEEHAALTDSEVAKIAEEFASDSNNSNSESSHDEKTIQTAESDEKEIKSISAKPKTETSKNTSKPMPAHNIATNNEGHAKTQDREPSSLPQSKNSETTTKTSAHYTVQVGSFPSEDEAKKLTTDLQNKGFKTSFIAAQVKGQTWYRVNVGLFGTSKEAEEYKTEFLAKTKLSSAFVQKVQ